MSEEPDNSAYGRRDYLDSPDGQKPGKRGKPGQENPRCYYSTTALARERELAQSNETWTPKSIADRAANIGRWALERWPASAPTTIIVETDDERILEDEDEDIDLD